MGEINMRREDLKRILNEMGFSVTDEQVEDFLSLYNYAEIKNQEMSKLRYEVWDGVSPINGISANVIRSQYPYANKIYLVYYNDVPIYLQPHKPFVNGLIPISEDEIDAVAGEHLNYIAENFATQKLIELAIEYFSR